MKVSSFLVTAAFFFVAVAGSGPSEATDLTRKSGHQRGQAVTSVRGVRGLLWGKGGAGVSFNMQGARGAAQEYSTDRHDRKAKKSLLDHHKRPSGRRWKGARELPIVGDRKMLRPPCITAHECAAKKLICLKKCNDLMNTEDPKCLIRCVKCIPTC